MVRLSRMAVMKIVKLANQGFSLLSTEKETVTLVKGVETVKIDTYGVEKKTND